MIIKIKLKLKERVFFSELATEWKTAQRTTEVFKGQARKYPRSDYANRTSGRVTIVSPVTRRIKLLSRSPAVFLSFLSLPMLAGPLNIHILAGVNFKILLP